MRIKKLNIINGRSFLGGKQPLAHIVWNEHNPNNPWKKGMVIHHKDKNTLNDDILNLELMTKQDHMSLHKNGLGHIVSYESKKIMSEKAKGRIISEETRKKMSESRKGLNTWTKGMVHSDETKRKISESNKGRISCMKGKKHSEDIKKKISLAISLHWQVRKMGLQNEALLS